MIICEEHRSCKGFLPNGRIDCNGTKAPVDYFNEYPGRFEILHIKDSKELVKAVW